MNMRLPLLLALGLSVAACKKKSPTAAGEATTETDQPVAEGEGSLPPAPSADLGPDRVSKVLAKSAQTLAAGDPTSARQVVEDLKALSSAAPDSAEIPFNIGVAYEILGDETNARKSYLRATDIDPSLGAAWLNLGAMSEAKGELDRALQSYEAGLRFDPNNGDLVVGVISILRKQGRYPLAVEQAQKALGMNSKNVNIYNNLGLIYLAQGQHDLASFVYQKALNSIEGAGSNAFLHANLGKVYLAKKQAFLARQELTEALRLDPNLIPAMVDLASMNMDDRNWTDAVALLEGARNLAPNDAAIYLNLGVCYRGQGRFEESLAAYRKALELDGNNPDPYLNIAVLQGDYMRSYDASLASIDRYLAAGGKNSALASQWRTELQAAKVKYEAELDRKRKRDERDSKRKEEERLASEFDKVKAARIAEADTARGQACPSVGCPDLLACNRDNICLDEGSPGTAVSGGECKVDTDCGFGLVCSSTKICQPGATLDVPPPTLSPAPPPTEAPSTPAPSPEAAPAPSPWGG